MSSLVLEIEDWPVSPSQPAIIAREALYFLLMTGSDCNVTWYKKGTAIGRATGLQGGDGIGPLSDAYDKVIIESDTAQTVKVATTSDPVTITRLSGTVKVDGVIQTAPDYSRVQKDEAFWAHRGRAPIIGEYSYSQIWNTATNSKNLIITAIYVTTTTQALMELSDVEMTAANMNNLTEQSAISMKITGPQVTNNNIKAKAGSSATNYATRNGMTLGIVDSGWIDLKQPIVLGPGTGFSAKTRSVNEEVNLNVQMFEVPA